MKNIKVLKDLEDFAATCAIDIKVLRTLRRTAPGPVARGPVPRERTREKTPLQVFRSCMSIERRRAMNTKVL